MRIVDAHLHVWDTRRAAYDWLADAPALGSAYGIGDARTDLRTLGVGDVVLVQAADNLDDTAHMLDVARSEPIVAGVVAWAPMDDPGRLEATIAGWADEPVVGLRHLIHRDPDPEWLIRADVHDSLDILGSRGLTFDVCAETTALLALVPTVAGAHPSTTFVVDHLGKPPVRERGWEPWASLLRDAATCPNVVVKLSGLNTAAGPDWSAADLVPYVEHARTCFGAERMMFGGDWPFALLNATSYAHVAGGLLEAIASWTEYEREAVLSSTARRVYRLRTSDADSV